MKKKLKFTKSHLICFILGALLFGLVGVSAATVFPSNNVTYDNTKSGLSSTDVQGAIDELYNSCSSSMNKGNYIYYIQENDGIYRMNIDGSNETRISDYGIRATSIYVTDDYIYYGTLGEGIFRMNINGGSSTRLGDYGISANSLYVTDDYIYYLYIHSSSSGYREIYRMPINGGTVKYIQEIRNSTGNIFIK